MKNKDKRQNPFLAKITTIPRRIARFVLSRYFITLVIIGAELYLIEQMFFIISENALVTTTVVFLFHAVGLIHLVNRNTNPEYKVTWLFVMMIPVAGVLLYFLFFERRLSKKETSLLLGIKDKLLTSSDRAFTENESDDGIIRALMADDPMAKMYRGTEPTFFSSGEAYFDSLIADIKTAKHFVYLEYFIIEDGELWDKIHKELRTKAEGGVDVRVLYDDIGCMQTLPSYYEYILQKEGISACRFGRVTPKLSAIHNNRDHRKIAVIDGVIGYTGGVNIADEYVNLKEKYGRWKDGGIRLFGDAAEGLERLFLSSWDYSVGKISDHVALKSDEKQVIGDGGIYIPFGSGPPPIYQQKVGKNLFLNIINQAKKSIFITTPYLIVDYELTEALCKASRRGVKVKIITPGVADKKIIKIMTKSSYRYLMKSGVEIYEYSPGFIHEKTLISDEKYLVVGTINFDYRSLMHHFEDGVLIKKSSVISVAKSEFEKTLAASDICNYEEAKLSLIEWLLRNAIKIFAPLL